MKPGLEKRVGAGLLVLLLLVAVVASWPGRGGSGTEGGVGDDGQGGRRAALLLLRELGFEAREWRQPPGLLPRAGELLWVARTPETHSLEMPEQRELHRSELFEPDQYRQFVWRGGTLVAAIDEHTAAFLVDDLRVEVVPDALFQAQPSSAAPRPDRGPVRLTGFSGAADLRVHWPVEGPFDRVGENVGGFVPLLVDESGRTLAFERELGRGRLILLGSDDFLDNDRIADADHALLFVGLVEELGRGAPVLFDEYALGDWRPDTAVELAFGTRFAWITVHLLLLLAVFTWRYAWVREFPRDPEPLAAISPLARARSTASLHERAGRYDVLARSLAVGVLERIAHRSTHAASSATDDPQGGAERLARFLDRLAASLGVEREVEVVRAAVFETPVRDRSELENLHTALTVIEERAASEGARGVLG